MRRAIAIAVLLLLNAPAIAQQPSATDLQLQRNQFMGAFALCDTASLTLQQQLAAAQAQIKTLQEKYEPKGEPAPK